MHRSARRLTEEWSMSRALEALYAGDDERARELLPPDDRLSVFEAAAFGRDERLEQLLDEDPALATAFAEDGFTALHLAVFGEQEAAARLLIGHGADVDAVATGEIARVAPLGTAAFVRSLALARVLLDAGADPDGSEEGGFTALHSAAQSGDEPLVRLLLGRGADPARAAADGRTPIDLAATDDVRRLLSA
jgi:ankyrin repeat protein